MKNRKGRRGRNVDRLSSLPDDVLLDILERLDTPDALRACILSRRMLRLPAKLSRISVDIRSMAPRSGRPLTSRDVGGLLNAAVADVTERVTSRSEVPIRDLSVTFSLQLPDCLSIGGSVARAMAAGKVVGAAEFHVATEVARGAQGAQRRHDDLVRFGEQFMEFVGACPDAFAGLTRLWLRNMRFGDGDLPGILAACGRLKSLRLEQCDSGFRSVVRLEHASLVELDIRRGQFARVELGCLPKLQRVRHEWLYYTTDRPVSLGFVPQLSELCLAANWTLDEVVSEPTVELSQLLANAPTVRDLHLDFRGEAIWVVPERPGLLAPVLRQLRVLNLDNLPQGCDMSWTMFFLEAAPDLRELCVTVSDKGRPVKNKVEWEPSVSNFRHEKLSKLTINGFQNDDNFLGYIRRVVKASVNMNMEDVTLYDMEGCQWVLETPEMSTTCRPGEVELQDMDRDAVLTGCSEDPISIREHGGRRCSLQVMLGFVCVAVACLLLLCCRRTWGLHPTLARIFEPFV